MSGAGTGPDRRPERTGRADTVPVVSPAAGTPRRHGTEGTRREQRNTALALLALTALTGLLTATDAPGRLPVVLLFVLVAPGWVVVAYLPVDLKSLRWAGSVAVGLAIAILVAQAMVSAHAWHPVLAMLVVVAATCLGLLHHLARFSAARRGRDTG